MPNTDENQPPKRRGRVDRSDERALIRLIRRLLSTRSSGSKTQSKMAIRRANNRTGSTGRRTFHARLKAITGRAGIGYAQYIHRADGRRAEELASDGAPIIGGDLAAWSRQAARLDAEGLARREWRAPTYGLEIELPMQFTPAQCREAMQLIARHWVMRGHPTVWGVHSHSAKGLPQPHGHLAILARDQDGVRHRPVEGGAAMREMRAEIARVVNAVADRHGVAMARYDGGDFAAVGVDRAARERLPVHVWKAREDRQAGRRLSRSRSRMADAADAYDVGPMRARQEAHEDGQPLPVLPPRPGPQIRLLRQIMAQQEAAAALAARKAVDAVQPAPAPTQPAPTRPHPAPTPAPQAAPVPPAAPAAIQPLFVGPGKEAMAAARQEVAAMSPEQRQARLVLTRVLAGQFGPGSPERTSLERGLQVFAESAQDITKKQSSNNQGHGIE